MKIKTIFSPKIILLILLIVSVCLRLFYVSDHQFIFFFDQARDASIATQISKGDWKIFGPTASGTNDTIFHGVFYYYFLTPFYAFTADPQFAIFGLAIFSAFSLFPVFFLTREIFKSEKIALLAAFFTAFSAVNIIDGTWLSNPALAVVFLPCFFYFFWRSLRDYKTLNLALAALFFGLAVQAAIYLFFWILLIIFGLFFLYFRQSITGKKFWQPLLIASFVFFCTVSSMVVAEIMMIKNGILNFSSFAQFNTGSSFSVSEHLFKIFHIWSDRIALILSPSFSTFFFVVFILGIIIVSQSSFQEKIKKYFIEQKISWIFLLTCLFVPLIFLLLFCRDSQHIFIGGDIIVYILVSFLVFLVSKNLFSKEKSRKIGLFVIAGLFIGANFSYLFQSRKDSSPYFAIQTGTSLQDQLNLIDYTYQVSYGQPFTISTLTSPYKINTVWNYLYNWYGKNKYGYTPKFFGSDQTGLIHEELLPSGECQKALFHFSITEPNGGIPLILINQFYYDQTNFCGTPSASLNFGTLRLDQTNFSN